MYFDNNYVKEERVVIGGQTLIRLVPRGQEDSLKTIIFYHGLGSNKENQRIRGYILSFFGYQVFLGDALHHGERDRKETEDLVQIYRYFWQAIIKNVEESEDLVRAIIKDYRADADHIYVAGHSMGAYSSAGILANNDLVRGALAINGSFDWESSNELTKLRAKNQETIAEEAEMRKYSPMAKLDRLMDKEILLISGELDQEVDNRPQIAFYENMLKRGHKNIEMFVHEGVGHYVTTAMLENMIKWLAERK